MKTLPNNKKRAVRNNFLVEMARFLFPLLLLLLLLLLDGSLAGVLPHENGACDVDVHGTDDAVLRHFDADVQVLDQFHRNALLFVPASNANDTED